MSATSKGKKSSFDSSVSLNARIQQKNSLKGALTAIYQPCKQGSILPYTITKNLTKIKLNFNKSNAFV